MQISDGPLLPTHLVFDYSTDNMIYSIRDTNRYYGAYSVGIYNKKKGINRIIASGMQYITGLAIAPAEGFVA